MTSTESPLPADPIPPGQCWCGAGWHAHGTGPFCGPDEQSFVAAFERLHQTPQPDAAPPAEVEWNGADEGEWLGRMDDCGIDTTGRTFGVGATPTEGER